MKAYNRNAITIIKTEAFLKWLKEVKPELHRLDINSLNIYPKNLTFQQFSEWFTFKMHESVIDLSEQDLQLMKQL